MILAGYALPTLKAEEGRCALIKLLGMLTSLSRKTLLFIILSGDIVQRESWTPTSWQWLEVSTAVLETSRRRRTLPRGAGGMTGCALGFQPPLAPGHFLSFFSHLPLDFEIPGSQSWVSVVCTQHTYLHLHDTNCSR